MLLYLHMYNMSKFKLYFYKHVDLMMEGMQVAVILAKMQWLWY